MLIKVTVNGGNFTVVLFCAKQTCGSNFIKLYNLKKKKRKYKEEQILVQAIRELISSTLYNVSWSIQRKYYYYFQSSLDKALSAYYSVWIIMNKKILFRKFYNLIVVIRLSSSLKKKKTYFRPRSLVVVLLLVIVEGKRYSVNKILLAKAYTGKSKQIQVAKLRFVSNYSLINL